VSKIGIVIQRCHESVVGGAESHAWQWASLLRDSYGVDVITTTALDIATWDNVLPAGQENREGVTVLRFAVDCGRTAYWHALHRLLLKEYERQTISRKTGPETVRIPWTMALQEEFILRQGPYSESLLDYLSEHSRRYKAIIFFTYLYPPTYLGMRMVQRGQCLLVPTLHDEAPAYLAAYRSMARRARSLLWNTEAERQFGTTLWGDLPGRIVGAAIAVDEYAAASLPYPYLLYCGRIDPHKRCDLLVEFFLRHKREHPSDLRLVLTGSDELGLPKSKDIEFRGYVSEEEKFQLMSGALLFVMPSPYESLSIVTLEAMAQRTPVLAFSESRAVVGHIEQSGGGFIYNDYASFSSLVSAALREPSKLITVGDRARAYVVGRYESERIVSILSETIEEQAI
jgi:glycosyltransferase involved in cell wall biosynthesis